MKRAADRPQDRIAVEWLSALRDELKGLIADDADGRPLTGCEPRGSSGDRAVDSNSSNARGILPLVLALLLLWPAAVAQAAGSCSFDDVTGTVSVSFTHGEVGTISRLGDAIAVDGVACGTRPSPTPNRSRPRSRTTSTPTPWSSISPAGRWPAARPTKVMVRPRSSSRSRRRRELRQAPYRRLLRTQRVEG